MMVDDPREYDQDLDILRTYNKISALDHTLVFVNHALQYAYAHRLENNRVISTAIAEGRRAIRSYKNGVIYLQGLPVPPENPREYMIKLSSLKEEFLDVTKNLQRLREKP